MNSVFFRFLFSIGLFLSSLNAAEPIVWNGVTYDDETVAKLITVITATSPIKSNPDTRCLYAAQSSLFKNSVFAKCKKIIVFDQVWPQNWGSEGHANYDDFKLKVADLTVKDPYFSNTDLIFLPYWGHLCGSIAEAISQVETPFVFMHQHDLLLLKDFDLNGIVATMVANPNIKYVTLWDGINKDSTWYTLYVDQKIEGVSFVPLCRMCGWTDRAHVASVEYYKDFVLPKCQYCFMEGKLNPELWQSVYSLGIDEGQKPYGTYFYGNLDDGEYILHIDGRKF